MLLVGSAAVVLWTLSCDPPDREATSEEATPEAIVPPGSTVVTLGFADGLQTQTRAAALLDKHGLRGTFYVNSGRIGRSGYLSVSTLRSFASAGHEIAGHTMNHVNLTQVSMSAAIREVCDDRAALLELGFPVTSFEYPFLATSDTARQIVISCNYNNARAGGLQNPFSCDGCPLSESIPPLDAFRIRIPGSVTGSYDLADLQSLVIQVESSGGGWMSLGMHKICAAGESCTGQYDIQEALLDQFLAWLAPRSSRGTYVMTTHQVVGGAP